MTEDEAKLWLQENFDLASETWEKLEAFRAFLLREALQQNLIAASTLDKIWCRHIVDSAQLLKWLPAQFAQHADWIDLGAGAGFPGIVAAILGGHRLTLVESRSRRIDYLQRVVDMLDLQNSVNVAGMPLERVKTDPYSVISARAFAPLPRLFDLAARFSTDKTIWLLPKGRNAVKEWQEVQQDWDADFRVEPSVTDAESGILVGRLFAKRQKLK
jgi:16S rRNA (guanine527-N7)-methyltransferase